MLRQKRYNLFMGEAPAGVATDFTVGVQTDVSVPQIKKDLFDPKTISKNNDQEGRDKLAGELREKRRERDALHQDMATTQIELDDRQSNLLVKLKTKLNIPDKQTQELEAVKLEQNEKDENLPDTRKMVEAYYEKVAESPLTNQEKRDLLKPEVLSQLSTDEYIALWKRLNPYFLTHVTRQGFRDHNAMFYHSAGLQEFHNGFLGVVQDEKMLRPPLALGGLKNRDETSVKMFLSEWALQAENEEEAKKRFDSQLHWSLASAPTYPDKTAVHFATQLVANDYYGGEKDNEIMFVFPSDTLASQHNFTFNGWEKDFTHPQSETKWNDVFMWPNTLEDPGITVDAGMVFLPEKAQVDPNTGSKYASEVKIIDGKEKRVLIENSEAVGKYNEWTKQLNGDNPFFVAGMQLRQEYKDRYILRIQDAETNAERVCRQELIKLGFDESLIEKPFVNALIQCIDLWGNEVPPERFTDALNSASARYKKAESPVGAKDYWEKYFIDHPDLKPKHIIYYDGDPTDAIYNFQRENGIGRADTSKTEGQLLGFEDHHVIDPANDPRANQGHEELVTMGNRIIEEHFKNKI